MPAWTRSLTNDGAECLAAKRASRGTTRLAFPVYYIDGTLGTAAESPRLQTQDALSHKKALLSHPRLVTRHAKVEARTFKQTAS